MQQSPRRFFAIAALILTAAIGIALWYWLRPAQFFWFWLLLAGIVTFLFYGFDKAQAKRSGWRVPEIVLHGMALAGGFIGAALGMAVFNHKTRKPVFLVVIVLSGVLWVGGYFLL
jgi:uncharacterized membrane protein YsdA (DUF1294 family)